MIFLRLIVDISCKECPIRAIASRMFFIIVFIFPLSCSKLLVTWSRAIFAFWIFFCRLSCENNSLFVSGADSFGQFSRKSRFFDFSFNWSRVNFVCHFNSTLLAMLSEIFGPFWQSTLSSKSICLSIFPVGDWWLGASRPSVSFDELFCQL